MAIDTGCLVNMFTYIASGLMVFEGIAVIFSFNFMIFEAPYYMYRRTNLSLFGILLFCAQCQFKWISRNFRFLTGFYGRGIFCIL